MMLPKTIVVPTDFTAGADAALDYATALAGKLDARVHLVHVVSVTALGASMLVPVTPATVDDILDGSQKFLDELVAARASLCAFGPTSLETGDAETQITNVATRLRADLIVMGTHGRRGFRRLVLGSVAEAVARVAPCPVLLVRSEAS